MTRPWWGADAPVQKPVVVPDLEAGGRRPQPHPTVDAAIAAEIRARIGSFTPSWTLHARDDAGEVLIDLITAQLSATARKVLDQLPLRARLELLRVAGIDPVAPRPRTTMLRFDVSPSAANAVEIPAGFQAAGRGPNGELVVFETDRNVMAVPGTIAVLASGSGGLLESHDNTLGNEAAFAAFGTSPAPNDGIYVAIDSPIAPQPRIAIGWFLATGSGAPAPFAAGTVPASAALPVVVWEVHDGRQFVPVEVLRDETASFTQSGVVELHTPRAWPAVAIGGLATVARWVRARLVLGSWSSPPALRFVVLNCVPASSGETVRDEVLAAFGDPRSPRAQMQVALPPVLERTLQLEVDEGEDQPTAWAAIDSLSEARPDDRVYVLDPINGIVTFGDGTHGMSLPQGFRHVHARSYRTIAPIADLATDAISTLLGSAPFVTAVANPVPVVGGTVPEGVSEVVRRGPRALRAGGRAIAASDYEVCALAAPADVRRAFAVPGLHPEFPGAVLPGVVGVIVVPSDRAQDGSPPMPDGTILRAVARYLAANAAPAGIEVVAVAPSYRRVRVEMQIVVPTGDDLGAAVALISGLIDAYLDPLTGGELGDGWPFGGPIRSMSMIRRLLVAAGGAVLAIPRLNLVIDGIRSVGCVDVPLDDHMLPWPEDHEIIPIYDGEVSP